MGRERGSMRAAVARRSPKMIQGMPRAVGQMEARRPKAVQVSARRRRRGVGRIDGIAGGVAGVGGMESGLWNADWRVGDFVVG